LLERRDLIDRHRERKNDGDHEQGLENGLHEGSGLIGIAQGGL